jgi:hypothetical protein
MVEMKYNICFIFFFLRWGDVILLTVPDAKSGQRSTHLQNTSGMEKNKNKNNFSCKEG